MRRTTPLTTTVVLGLALLAPTTAASAAVGETCRGEAATIVGTQRTVVGTEGRDVIVSGNATEVRALGGDDLVCIVPQRTNLNVLTVDAGAGNDLVDTAGAGSGYYIETDLGAGADTLEGGAGGDWVETGDPVGITTEVDVVRGGSGDDIVTTSGGSDVIDLGIGNDRLELQGGRTDAGGRLDGGEGRDTLIVSVAPPSSHVFDMAAGTYRSAGDSATFSSIEGLNLAARSADITYTGTAGDDVLNVRSSGSGDSVLRADTFGGDDYLALDGSRLGEGSRVDSGSGANRLVAARTKGRLGLDLARDELTVAGVALPAAGFVDAFLMARRVALAGDEQDNSLSSLACTTDITGGRGDDELIWQGDYVFEAYSFRCTKTATMRGGSGDDSFYGSPGQDRLIGGGGDDTIRGEAGDDRIRGGAGDDKVQAGPSNDDVRGGSGADKLFGNEGRDVLMGNSGRDLAAGGPGRDRCVAEREKGCER